jgi:cysteine desulfurase
LRFVRKFASSPISCVLLGEYSKGADGRRRLSFFCRSGRGDRGDAALITVYICSVSSTIYLDHNSTTPVDPRVLEAMLPFFSHEFGNAASRTHRFGWYAAQAVESARERVAEWLGCETQEVIFTSGATESINTAIKGIAHAYAAKGKHIITVQTEHKAVLDTCTALQEQGYEISQLHVDREGKIDLSELRSLLRADTVLVAVMLANNETGTIQDTGAIAELVHANQSILFSDTAQAFGKLRVDVNELGIDCCCISAHKAGGPKGVGALYIRRKNPRVTVLPLLHGGGHERGIRSGTLNVPGIVALGKAAELALNETWDVATRLSAWRTRLEQYITEDDRGFINGSVKDRLPNTSSIMLRGIKADKLIMQLPDLAISTGSACSSALPEPSHVLRAMGLSNEEALSSIRISLGSTTTEAETIRARELIRAAADALRAG